MPELVHRSYSFDRFTVDLARGCLTREGEELKLRPKSFKLLVHLVENERRLISKEELMSAIWPDVAVTDDSVTQCLIEIRKVLGGEPQRYIKTVPRRGYIFDAQVAVKGRPLGSSNEQRQDAEVAKAVDALSATAGRADSFPTAASRTVRLLHNKMALAGLILAVAVLSIVPYWLTRRPTPNVQALLSYERGNESFGKNTRNGHLKAIEYYNDAIRQDPNFARAHVALAKVYVERFCPKPPMECQQVAASELGRALELDHNLPEAHALLGEVRLEEQDYSEAEREFNVAIHLGPRSEPVLGGYWRYLLTMGRFDDAIAVAESKRELNPHSTENSGIVPFILLREHHCDEALKRFQKLHDEDPQYVPASNNMGVAYICKEMFKEAIALLEPGVRVQQAKERDSFGILAYAYAKSGMRAKAEEMLQALQEERSRIPRQNFALIYAGLGDNNRAFDEMEKAYKDRSAGPMIHLMNITLVDALRSDQRWPDFAQRKRIAP